MFLVRRRVKIISAALQAQRLPPVLPGTVSSSLRVCGTRPIRAGHRFGHFHYVVPVATGRKYTLKLHFMEHWFGVQNGGIGGVGSRVFDVSCNGSMLLRGFDIFGRPVPNHWSNPFRILNPRPRAKSKFTLRLLSTIYL